MLSKIFEILEICSRCYLVPCSRRPAKVFLGAQAGAEAAAGRLPARADRAGRALPLRRGAAGRHLGGVAAVRSEVNTELNFPPNFEGLVLGCIDADFCK